MTSKKSLFVLALSLFLAAFGTLNAQGQSKLPQFTVTTPVPNGAVTTMSAEEAARLGLRNASELTADELGGGLTNNPNFCTVYTTTDCTGPSVQIPLNVCLNSTPPALRSVRFGGTRTIWWTGPNCTGPALVLSGFPQDACITTNPVVTFASIACVTP
jgi:hypothetical protein